MKKSLLIMIVTLVAVISNAALIERVWTSPAIGTVDFGVGSEPMPQQGTTSGAGWQTDIIDATGGTGVVDEGAGTAANLGWYDGYGYYWNQFNYSATEGLDVAMRLYDNVDSTSAGFYLDSGSIALPDLSELAPPSPTDLTPGTFDFAGSTWQAVPEPATIGLFGLGALGAWIVRRRKMS